MKIVATHPLGTEIHLEGFNRKALKTIFDEWYLTNTVLLNQAAPEPSEPQKNGAESLAQHSGPRYFESESVYGQDVPIIQASTGDNITRIPLGFTRNEETA